MSNLHFASTVMAGIVPSRGSCGGRVADRGRNVQIFMGLCGVSRGEGTRVLKRYVFVGNLAAALLAAAPAVAATLPTVSVVRDVRYATVGRVALKLDVYRAAGRRRRPVSCSCTAAVGVTATRQLLRECDAARPGGIRRGSVNFRLACTRKRTAPLCGYRFPAQVSDVERAVRWVALHAGATARAGPHRSARRQRRRQLVLMLGMTAARAG